MTETAARPAVDVAPVTAETRARMERARDRYPRPMSAILPSLWAVQDQYGWLPPSGMATVAEVLGLTPSEVQAVATFYSMYFQRPAGRHHVLVCVNTSCALRGADDLCAHLERRLGVPSRGTTADGEFTWEATIECLGACGYAPMMQIDHHFHEFLTTSERVDAALDSVRGAPAPHAAVTMERAAAAQPQTPSGAAAPLLAPGPVAPPHPPEIDGGPPGLPGHAASDASDVPDAAPGDPPGTAEQRPADRPRRRGRRAK